MPRIHPKPGSRRQAAILFITIVLLTLFLVIGLCFILFSESQATSARVYREANNIADALPSQDTLMNWAFSQLIYGVSDDSSGAYSAMRGHDFGRDLYGFNYQENAGQIINYNSQVGFPVNATPFNGSGHLHTAAGGVAAMNPFGIDDVNLPSYMYYSADGFKRDPERFTNG